MPDLTRDAVLDALNGVTDPVTGQGLSDAGLVRGLVVSAERLGFMIEVPQDQVPSYQDVRSQAEAVLARLPGVKKAQVVLTAEAPGAPPREPSGEAVRGPSAKLSDRAVSDGKPKAPVATARPDHVRRVVVVGSGKGGVGKSTLSLAIALGLRAQGLKVGFLDADIYGPSAPVMLGLNTPPAFGEDKRMVPLEAFGLKVNSVGFLVDPDQAMIWRGPMASQALTQLLTQTRWGTPEEPLDVLVIDLPPGTGDVQLTLTQKTLIDGAVVVSTPQEMALSDARRAVTLFAKTGIKMLGVIENMAWFTAPDGSEIEIFGRGGARAMAAMLNVPFLGEVPLDLALRQGSDTGRPLTSTQPDGAMAECFQTIAGAIAQALEAGN